MPQMVLDDGCGLSERDTETGFCHDYLRRLLPAGVEVVACPEPGARSTARDSREAAGCCPARMSAPESRCRIYFSCRRCASALMRQ